MSQIIEEPVFELPASMHDKLREVGKRMNRVGAVTAVIAGLAVFLSAMLLAMLIDYFVVLYDSPWRYVLTGGTLASAGLVFAGWLAWERSKTRSLKSVACEVDRQLPELEERWWTLTQLSMGDADPIISHPAMLGRVTREAEKTVPRVNPQEVVQLVHLAKSMAVLCLIVLLMAVVVLFDWRTSLVLMGRFWSPGSNISLTRIDADPGDTVAGRGEELTLAGQLDGVRVEEASLLVKPSHGESRTFLLLPGDEPEPRVSHRFKAVQDSFVYRFRAGDGQTRWHEVIVADPPQIEEVRLSIIPPDYRREKEVHLDKLPRQCSAVAGSLLELAIKSKQEVRSAKLLIDEQGVIILTADKDGWYRWRTELKKGFTLSPILTESHGLTNRRPPTTQIDVVPDFQPEVRIISPDDAIVVASNDTINIDFVAEDDNGISGAELVIVRDSDQPGGAPVEIFSQPISLGEQVGEKSVKGKTTIDLSQFELPDGTSISYQVRVSEDRSIRPRKMRDAAAGALVVAEGNASEAASTGQPDETQTAAAEEQAAEDSSTDEAADVASNTSPEESSTGAPGKSRVTAQSKRTVAATSDGKKVANAGGKSPQRSPNELAQETTEPTGDASRGEENGSRSEAAGEERLASATKKTSPEGSPGEKKVSSTKTEPKRSGEKSPEASPDGSPADSSEGASDKSPDESPADADAEGETKERSPEGAQTASISGMSEKRRPGGAGGGGPKGSPGEKTDGTTTDETGKSSEEKQSSEGTQSTEGTASSTAEGSPGKTAKESKTAAKGGGPNQSPGERKTAAGGGGPQSTGEKTAAGGGGPKSKPNGSQTASGGGPNASQSPSKGKGGNQANSPAVGMRQNKFDTPQSASSRAMRIKIDKWAGSFSGQMRAKLEITIAPALVQIREQLLRAQAISQGVVEEMKEGAAWEGRHDRDITEAEGAVKQAQTIAVDLQNRTKETPYTFIGLKMGDIAEANLTPARREFLKTSQTEGEKRVESARSGWNHVGQALDRLDNVSRSFESARQDFATADKAQQIKKMYQIYVEGAFPLLVTPSVELARHQRKMDDLEYSEEYLARYKEVLEMRHKMRAELARILAEDPRLRRRFIGSFLEYTGSVRTQVGQLVQRQQALGSDTLLWVNAEEKNRAKVLQALKQGRLIEAPAISLAVGKMADRFESWLPINRADGESELSRLNTEAQSLAAQARELGLTATKASAQADDAKLLESLGLEARELVGKLKHFESSLQQMDTTSQLEGSASFKANRLIDTQKLIASISSWAHRLKYLSEGDFHKVAAVEQNELALERERISGKLAGTIEIQLLGLPKTADSDAVSTIVKQAREVVESLDKQATPNEQAAAMALNRSQLPRAKDRQQAALEALTSVEQKLDEVMQGIIDELDKIPAEDPLAELLRDPTLDEILLQLEQELASAEDLGIPDRRRNLQVIDDWPVAGQNDQTAMMQNAQMLAEMLRQEQQRMMDAAEAALKKATERIEKQNEDAVANSSKGSSKGSASRWNKVVSELEDDILQGRDKLPPEKYRAAIEGYYEIINREVSQEKKPR